MLRLSVILPEDWRNDNMRILVFAPHNDDEVLGVGGTIAKYANLGHEVFVCEVTSWLENMEETNIIRHEALKAHEILGVKDTFFLELPVVHLKETPTHIKNKKFLDIVSTIEPEIAFIPHVGDMHADHGETAEAAMVALRPINNPKLRAIYTYETLSETEWNIPNVSNAFIPNIWSDISETYGKKIEAMKCFKTQLCSFPHPRSQAAIEALAKLRGSTIGVNYAESFFCVREKI